MLTQPNSPSPPARQHPRPRRDAILKAALSEFAQEGLAGARMDAIAETAGVNKALLYYYFRDKEALYGAVLDGFFLLLTRRVIAELESGAPAGNRVLRYTRAHFDSIAESPHYARIFQSELMSAGRGESPHLSRIVEEHIRPIATRLIAVLKEGIASGEFRAVDPFQFAPSIAAINVHYFVIAPVARKLFDRDPYSPEAIAERRSAVLDFIAAALFADRTHGIKLAKEVAMGDQPPPAPAGTKSARSHKQGKRP